MPELRYIQVLLPLRLKWEPLYSCSLPEGEGIPVGTRVRVEFAGKEYVGAVTSGDAREAVPGLGENRIKPIIGYADGLERITPEELALWRQVADYYLCTAGEVFKAA